MTALADYCGLGSNSANNLARHSPSTIPSIMSGRDPALERDHGFLRVGHVIAETLEREQEAGVGPERVDQVAGRAR